MKKNAVPERHFFFAKDQTKTSISSTIFYPTLKVLISFLFLICVYPLHLCCPCSLFLYSDVAEPDGFS